MEKAQPINMTARCCRAVTCCSVSKTEYDFLLLKLLKNEQNYLYADAGSMRLLVVCFSVSSPSLAVS